MLTNLYGHSFTAGLSVSTSWVMQALEMVPGQNKKA